MKVLIACESSGIVRDAFAARGHDAWSCDLLTTEKPGNHLQCDVLTILHGGWDLMIAHPDCKYLCSSGLHWNKRTPWRQALTEKALEFVYILMSTPIDRIAIENPVGCISTRIKKASQYIQPYEFGHDASKRTGLWLKNLEPLTPTEYIEPRIVNDKKRWSNQTDSGQNRLAPSADRWKDRARTYEGIAEAMANQWG